jgi:superfamily I DNA/RNA helicase
MELTKEQSKILNSNFLKGTSRISARAGSGKTFILERIAEKTIGSRSLLVTFAKQLQMEASKRLPSHCVCKTAHSLAFGSIGRKYADAQKLKANMSLWEVIPSMTPYIQSMGINAKEQIALEVIGVMNTINNFLVSFEHELSLVHVSKPAKSQLGDYQILSLAQTLWMRMIDVKSQMSITHDVYLKLYQIDKPKLHYDLILFDEAQDANPSIADIIFNQTCPKVFVGDSFQGIYEFRGAVDSMNLIKVFKKNDFVLSRSFRFGEKVGKLASEILSSYKNEVIDVIGMNGEGEIVESIPEGVRHTVLCRTNTGILMECLSCVEHNIPFHLLGGYENYRFQFIIDVYNLYQGNKYAIKDPEIRSFADFYEFSSHAQETQNVLYLGAIKLVRLYPAIDDMLGRIKSLNREDPSLAQVILTTGHKSKGLEWDCVKISNDFNNVFNMYRDGKSSVTVQDIPQNEINLLYVAITRAKKKLVIGEIGSTIDWIRSSKQ